ncbi:MAG: hypothetical protein LBR52_06315, partial [Prevotellaceae bacterium]|nr:hypothetical protein [Prevotellaceae bacterium]
MKTGKIYWKILVVALLTLFGGQAYAQTCTQVVAGGSTFEGLPGSEEYRDFNNTAQFGLSGNKFSTPLTQLAETTVVGTDPFYVVTDNPTLVDEDFLDLDDPMLIVAGVGTNSELFSFSVLGLTPGAPFTVTLEGYIVNESNTTSACVPGSATNDPTLQILLDPQTNNGNNANWANHQKDQSIKTGLGGGKFTITITQTMPATNSGFTYMVKSGYNYAACMAVGFTKIEVVSCLNLKVAGPHTVCAGGENAILSVGSSYQGPCTYQWYKDGTLILGATSSTYRHSSNLTGAASTTYYYTMTPQGGPTVKSENFVIQDILCCVDDSNMPAPRKMIWQEDYGTFTSANSYWEWDYTDINNPKKVTKNTTGTNVWRKDGPYAGSLSYAMGTGDVGDGMYAVIANIAQNVGGLNWAAKAGDGRQWSIPNYFPDHTYPDREAYGACLMINCAGIPGEKLYERTINGLCDKKLTVKCFINNFSDGSTPVKVKIRITEIKPNGADGISEESAEITRYADGADGIAWKEVSVDIDLPSLSNSIRFEVFSSQSGANDGNDLLLDDIQVYTCSSPSVSLFFNSGLTETVTETCEGDDVTLYVDETPMLTNYFGAQLAYIFQYTYDDPFSFTFDQKSYKNIAPAPIQAASKDNLKSIFDAFKAQFPDPNDKKMYFRVVSGDMSRLTALNGQPGFFFNQNEACADYSVSDPIEASINCATCTKPVSVKILADGVFKDTVGLCESETVTLEVDNLY